MGVKDGERCVIDGGVDFDFLLASLQCGEGLGCVPNERNGDEGTCQKISTRRWENKTCSSNEDCPLDSFCECNDENGRRECIPIPTATRELVERVYTLEKSMQECFMEFERADHSAVCVMEVQSAFYQYMGKNAFYYDSEYRCADLSPLCSASPIRLPFVGVIVAAVLPFLFFLLLF